MRRDLRDRMHSARSEREVLPHLFWKFHSESKTAHSAQANGAVNSVDVDVPHVGETALNQGTKTLDGRTATNEDHVLAELVVVFRVGASDELLHVLNNGVNDGFDVPCPPKPSVNS